MENRLARKKNEYDFSVFVVRIFFKKSVLHVSFCEYQYFGLKNKFQIGLDSSCAGPIRSLIIIVNSLLSVDGLIDTVFVLLTN